MTITTISHRSTRTLIVALGGLLLIALAMTAGAAPTHAGGLVPVPPARPTPPDLLIKDVSVTTIDGDTFMKFTVKNVGGADAGPFTVVVRADNGAFVQAITTGGLGAGGTLSLLHKLPGCVPYGLLSRTVIADYGNAVAELSEANNSHTENFMYGPSCP